MTYEDKNKTIKMNNLKNLKQKTLLLKLNDLFNEKIARAQTAFDDEPVTGKKYLDRTKQ